MSHYEKAPIVVVGAGHAGGRAVEALRALDPQSRIVLVGEETDLPYERPALSKDLLLGRAEVSGFRIRPFEWYRDEGVDLRLGVRVASIGPSERRVRLADGQSLPYSNLVLTTGARARRLPTPLDDGTVLYLRSLQDAARIASLLEYAPRVAIVGAGFIGLEVAAAARQRGCAIEVVERAPHPLARVVDVRVGRAVAALHAGHGVRLRLGVGIEAITSVGSGRRLLLDDGSSMEADHVIAGIGAVPNTELAQEAGIPVDDGIVTDWEGRTAIPSVWAAGDCTRHRNPLIGQHMRLETWQNAQDQAIALAHALNGKVAPRSAVPWFWSDQFDANIQCAGFPDEATHTLTRGDPEGTAFSVIGLREDRVVSALCFNERQDMRFLRKIIERAAPVDPGALADKGVALASFLKSLQ